MAQPADATPRLARVAHSDSLLAEFVAEIRASGAAGTPLRRFVALAEAWRITRALEEARGNRTAAARALGIGRRTLYSKLAKLGLD